MKMIKLVLVSSLIFASYNMQALTWKKHALSALATISTIGSLVQAKKNFSNPKFKTSLANLRQYNFKRSVNDNSYRTNIAQSLEQIAIPMGDLAKAILFPSLIFYLNEKSGLSRILS